MRTDIRFELKCAQCGDIVRADSDSKFNKIEGNSAYHFGATMSIVPCERCLSKAGRPGKLMQEALNMLSKEA